MLNSDQLPWPGMQDAETAREAICQRCSRPTELQRRCEQLSDAGCATRTWPEANTCFSVHTHGAVCMKSATVTLKPCCRCRVPKLDEFIITLSNIGRAEHIREAVGHGPEDALRAPPADAEASSRQVTAGMHTPAGSSAAAPSPMPRLPATTLAETPLYTKRLGRPPITPGNQHQHLPCCNTYSTCWL